MVDIEVTFKRLSDEEYAAMKRDEEAKIVEYLSAIARTLGDEDLDAWEKAEEIVYLAEEMNVEAL